MGFKMTDILPPAGWLNVRQLETNEFATGGANGNMNEQAKSLAARSELLKQYAALPYESKTGGYALGATVKLDNGDIVKSTVVGNANNPNVDMTGWVNPNKDLKDTVNKIAPLDTIPTDVDATQFLQSLIDKMTDGMTLDLLGRTFKVSKSTAYQSLYPANDQPCLIVYNKKNIKITNGKLKTDKHGQGIIDFRNCPNWLLDGVELEGFGNNFPPIDGVTGRAEKTDSPASGYFYDSSGLFPRNNSVDTSTRTTGGYGGNFPQFEGGVAATWGMWGGGFICNIAYGVYQEDSFGCVQNCKIHGFNGSGVFGKNYKSMIVMHSEIFNCYVAGVESHGFNALSKQPEMFLTAFNSIHDIGHPSASVSHNNIDPGYGITTGNSNNTFGRPKVYMTQGNIVSRCKRKGIDAHSSDIIIVKNNVVSETGYGIVSVTNLGTNPKSVTIIGNNVENIQYCANDSAHGIQVRGINRNSGVAVVSNNTVKNVGRPITSLLASINGRSIYTANILSATVSGNTIENDGYIATLGIGNAINASQCCPNFVCTGNQIKGMFSMGIFISGAADSISAIEKLKQSVLANSNAIHLYSLKPHFNQDQFCISSLKSAKTTGNLLIIDDYVSAKYLNDFAERRSAANEEVWFSIVKDASSYVLNVKSQSGGMPIDISQITSSVESNKLKIVIPSFYPMPIDSAISQKNQLKTTSGVPVNSLYMAQDNYTRSLTLNLENINGSTITPVNFQDLAVGCELSVNLKF